MSGYHAAIVVVSTKGSKGERDDLVGAALSPKLKAAGFSLAPKIIIPDDREIIAATLIDLIDKQNINLILTSGGTGLSPSDVTPEATADVAERYIPGFAEAMRATGRATTPHADLSRAVAVQRRQSLIINLPGSPQGALENLDVILPALMHALDKITGDSRDCAHIHRANS